MTTPKKDLSPLEQKGLEQPQSSPEKKVPNSIIADQQTTDNAHIQELVNTADAQFPVDLKKQEILELFRENDIVVLTAETGAGKSTQVPQYLMDAGYRVIVTQPRRIAAKSLSSWVAKQRGVDLGGEEVGFWTGRERKAQKNTRLLYCTDGLQLVRELAGGRVKGMDTVLVLDEVHEWNINMETLLAWVKMRKMHGAQFKVLLMSATLEAQKLAAYVNNCPQPSQHDEQAPIVEVPGKLYPVVERHSPSHSLCSEVEGLVNQGRNVLVFQPGKKQIEQTIKTLQEQCPNAVVLPLHGQLDAREQQKAFKHYDQPKVVVATNVAQTSITIDDIDAVVDSAVERRGEVDKDGIEGLFLRDISKADCIQRKGRAGRCREGIYVLCSDTSWEQRPDFPKPEIQRVRLDQTVLRLAVSGIDATELDFFHQPDKEALNTAKQSLIALGAMNESGDVTEMGRKMAKLPVDVHIARMVVEAEKRHCLDDVLTIAAILQEGGITHGSGYDTWRKCTAESQSDFIAQLEVWQYAGSLKKSELRDHGIMVKNYFRAKDTRAQLARRLSQAGIKRNARSKNADREDLLKSVVSGLVDHLYKLSNTSYEPKYVNGRDSRIHSRNSVVSGTPQWLVGKPIDIQTKNVRYSRRGRKRNVSSTTKLLTLCSAVDPVWMAEVAPHLVSIGRRGFQWSNEHAGITQEEFTTFNGTEIGVQIVPSEPSNEATKAFSTALATRKVQMPLLDEVFAHNTLVREQSRAFWERSGGSLKAIESADECEHYYGLLEDHQICSVDQLQAFLSEMGTLEDFKLHLDEYMTPEDRSVVEKTCPLHLMLDGEKVPLTYSGPRSSWERSFRITISLDIRQLNSLSDEDISSVLPSGRSLSIKVSTPGYTQYAASTIERLQDAIENDRLQGVFQEWKGSHTEKTTFPLVAGRALPDLPEPCVYDSQTGSKAYPGLYISSWNAQGEIRWYRSEKEAQQKNDGVRTFQRKIDAKERGKALYDELQKASPQIASLYDLYPSLDAQWNRMQREVSDVYRRLPDTVERVDAEWQELQLKITELLQEKQTIEDELASGQALRNFTHFRRRGGMTNNADAWVIRADGTLREADSNTVPRYKSDGDFKWNLVRKGELAVSWRCQTKNDLMGTSTFTVHLRPPSGPTASQLDTIRQIEAELGVVPDSFDLDPVVKHAQLGLVQEILKRYTMIPGTSLALCEDDLDPLRLLGSNGCPLRHVSAQQIIAMTNLAAPFPETCEGRPAQVVASKPVGEQTIEWLTFEMYGTWNLNVRVLMRNSAKSVDMVATETRDGLKQSLSPSQLVPESLRPIIDQVSCGIETAQNIQDFAEQVLMVGTQGNRDLAVSILSTELHAAYGRAMRQRQINSKMPAISSTEIGQKVLSFRRASDLNMYLDGSIAWIDVQPRFQDVPQPPIDTPSEPAQCSTNEPSARTSQTTNDTPVDRESMLSLFASKGIEVVPMKKSTKKPSASADTTAEENRPSQEASSSEDSQLKDSQNRYVVPIDEGRSFQPITEMSLDETIDELIALEDEINEILDMHPTIDELFETHEQLVSSLAQVKRDMKALSAIRKKAPSNTIGTLVQQLEDLKRKKKTINPTLQEVKRAIKPLVEVKDLLDVLRKRKTNLENAY